jgi:hypothetical protein
VTHRLLSGPRSSKLALARLCRTGRPFSLARNTGPSQCRAASWFAALLLAAGALLAGPYSGASAAWTTIRTALPVDACPTTSPVFGDLQFLTDPQDGGGVGFTDRRTCLQELARWSASPSVIIGAYTITPDSVHHDLQLLVHGYNQPPNQNLSPAFAVLEYDTSFHFHQTLYPARTDAKGSFIATVSLPCTADTYIDEASVISATYQFGVGSGTDISWLCAIASGQ